jgi:hypothetical protein
MKNSLLPVLLLLPVFLWTSPASSDARARLPFHPPSLQEFAAAGLAPDAVPSFSRTAAGRETKTPPGTPSVHDEARHFVDEALPLLPPSWTEREKYWAGRPGSSLPAGEGTGGAAWNDFYLRNLRISLSTVPGEDAHLKNLVPRDTTESGRWEQFRSVPDQLRVGSYRDAVDALGVVIEPRIRLGIEF